MKPTKCPLLGRWGRVTFMLICEFFPARRQHQSLAVCLWERECTQHSLDFHFPQNDGTIIAVVLHQILPEIGNTHMETSWKIQQALDNNAKSITLIKEWHNQFNDGCISVKSNLNSNWLSTNWKDKVIDQMQNFDHAGLLGHCSQTDLRIEKFYHFFPRPSFTTNCILPNDFR